MTIPRIGSRDIEQLHRSLEADVPRVHTTEEHRDALPHDDVRDASRADPSSDVPHTHTSEKRCVTRPYDDVGGAYQSDPAQDIPHVHAKQNHHVTRAYVARDAYYANPLRDIPRVRSSDDYQVTQPYNAKEASKNDSSRAYDMSALDAAATAAETSNTEKAYSTLMKEIHRLELSAVENHEAARYWAYRATAHIFYKDLKSAVDCGVQSYYLDQTCAALGLELKVRVALKVLESKPREAISLLEPVLRIRPHHREALEGLVKAFHHMGPKKEESKMAAIQTLRARVGEDARLRELMHSVEVGECFDRMRYCLLEAQKILQDGLSQPRQPVNLLNEAHCIAKDKCASVRTQGLLWRWSAIANFQFGKFEDAKRHFLMATRLDAETTEYISKSPAVTTASVIDPDFLPQCLVSAFVKLMHSWKIDQQSGHLEAWRAKIKEGDPVDVWSQSHGAWVKGEVESTDGDIVTAALCSLGFYKKVHRTSTHIRLPQVASGGTPHESSPTGVALSTSNRSKNAKIVANGACDLHGTASTNHSSSASSPHEGQLRTATIGMAAHRREVKQEEPRGIGCVSIGVAETKVQDTPQGGPAINVCDVPQDGPVINERDVPQGGPTTNGCRAPECSEDTDARQQNASSSQSESCGTKNWFDSIADLIKMKRTAFASRVTAPPGVQVPVAQGCAATTAVSPPAAASTTALNQQDVQDDHTTPTGESMASVSSVVKETEQPGGATTGSNNSGATSLTVQELPKSNVCQSAEKYMKNAFAIKQRGAGTKHDSAMHTNATVTPACDEPRSASPSAHDTMNAHQLQSPPSSGSNAGPMAAGVRPSSDSTPVQLLRTQLCTYPAAKTLTTSRSVTPQKVPELARTEHDAVRVAASGSSSSVETIANGRHVEVEGPRTLVDGEFISAPGATVGYTSARPCRSSEVVSAAQASGYSPSTKPLRAPSICASTTSAPSVPACRAPATSKHPGGTHCPSATVEHPSVAQRVPATSLRPAVVHGTSANAEERVTTSFAFSQEQPTCTSNGRTSSREKRAVVPQHTPATSVPRHYTQTSQEPHIITRRYRTASPEEHKVTLQHTPDSSIFRCYTPCSQEQRKNSPNYRAASPEQCQHTHQYALAPSVTQRYTPTSQEQGRSTTHCRTDLPDHDTRTPQHTPAPSMTRRYTPTSQEHPPISFHCRAASPQPPHASPQNKFTASITSAPKCHRTSGDTSSITDTVVASPVAPSSSTPSSSTPSYVSRPSASCMQAATSSCPTTNPTRATHGTTSAAPPTTTPPYVSTRATPAYSSVYSPSMFTPTASYATSASSYSTMRQHQNQQQPGHSAARSFSPPAYTALQCPPPSSHATALPSAPPGVQRGVPPATSAYKHRPTAPHLSSVTPLHTPAVNPGSASPAPPVSCNALPNYNNHLFTLHKDDSAHKGDSAPMRRQWVTKASPAVREVAPRTSSPSPIIQHLRAQPHHAGRTTTTPLSTATTCAAPSVLGDCALDLQDLQYCEVLGKGGFGSVYRGLYKGQEVAIKKLHVEDGLGACCMTEFEKEVLTLQKLKHERLVTMIGAISDSPNLIMVLEYMAGGSLYTLLHVDKEVLIPSRKQMLSMDMASGVTFLHDFKPPAVHRDLKSMNVVLDASRQRCKLCDFGLTQTMEKTHITRKDQEGGSPRYMCPELFDPKTKITEKVDVWALGCLIAETFTGRLPHQECQSLPQVMNKLLVQKQGPFSSPAPLVINDGNKQLIHEIFASLELEADRRTTARNLLKALTAQ